MSPYPRLQLFPGAGISAALTVYMALTFAAMPMVAFEPQAGDKKEHHGNAAEFLPLVKKSVACVADGKKPDPDCTPGAAMGISTTAVCTTSTRGRRHVTQSMRKEVYAAYGHSFPQPKGKYEVDHFIPLELGGSNEIANLWPQPADPMPGFHQKDCVEDYLHAQVCKAKTMTLAEAQRALVSDWLTVFNTKAKGSRIGQCNKWGK